MNKEKFTRAGSVLINNFKGSYFCYVCVFLSVCYFGVENEWVGIVLD